MTFIFIHVAVSGEEGHIWNTTFAKAEAQLLRLNQVTLALFLLPTRILHLSETRKAERRDGAWGTASEQTIFTYLFVYFQRIIVGIAVAELFLIAFFFFFWHCDSVGGFWNYVVYGGEGSVPGTPDDVVEWLLAVYLLVCRYQHSVLELSGTTVFYPPPPPYLNISN